MIIIIIIINPYYIPKRQLTWIKALNVATLTLLDGSWLKCFRQTSCKLQSDAARNKSKDRGFYQLLL